MTIDETLCEDLVRRCLSGDGSARDRLLEYLWPHWLRLVRGSRSMTGFTRSDDHVRNVAMVLFEKFSRPDGHVLRLYVLWIERHQDKAFSDWLRIVVKNAARDYVRQQLGSRLKDDGTVSIKRLLNEVASSPLLDELGKRPPITAAQTVRELMEFAQDKLPPDQLEALRGWLEGESFEELAEKTGSNADGARRLVRAAIATLRRHFAPSEAGLF